MKGSRTRETLGGGRQQALVKEAVRLEAGVKLTSGGAK